MRASSFNQQGQGMAGPNGRDVEKDWEPALLMTMEATRPPPESDHELSPISSRQHQSPLRKSDHPFDAVLARHLLHHIIDLYFDNIYCLIPCLHRPTFIHDLHSSREEHAGDHEWTALVFSVVAVTLVQLPRAFVAMPRKEVKALVLRCYGLAREYLNRDFKEVTVTRCACLSTDL